MGGGRKVKSFQLDLLAGCFFTTREAMWTATLDALWSRNELSLLEVKSESVSYSVVSDSLRHCGL